MNRPTRLVIDCSTGVSSEVELTDEEIAEQKLSAERYAKEQAEREALAQAQADLKTSAFAKLQALGLTKDEAIALLG